MQLNNIESNCTGSVFIGFTKISLFVNFLVRNFHRTTSKLEKLTKPALRVEPHADEARLGGNEPPVVLIRSIIRIDSNLWLMKLRLAPTKMK